MCRLPLWGPGVKRSTTTSSAEVKKVELYLNSPYVCMELFLVKLQRQISILLRSTLFLQVCLPVLNGHCKKRKHMQTLWYPLRIGFPYDPSQT
jgi:hypothetical protein